MSISDEILAFAAALPSWERDLMRRLAIQATLSDKELAEIKDLLYKEHGIDSGTPLVTPVPLSKDHFGGSDADLPKTVLCSLEEIENTNKLATGQALPFAVEGMTIVYGDNGSGKTGYARLLKALCRARRDHPEPILGNVYDAKQKQPASVKVTYHSDGANQSVTWKDGTPPPGELCRISVFDSSTVPLYADRQNRLEFLPQGLDVIPRLGSALARLAAVTDQDSALTKQALAVPLPTAPAGSKAADLFIRLATESASPLPTTQEIEVLGHWDHNDTANLVEVEAQIRALEEPTKALARYGRGTAAVNRIRAQVVAAENAFTTGTPEIIQQLRERLTAAQSTASIVAQEEFSADPFGAHVGTNPWRRLYEHAREFSKVAYPERDFPVTDEGSFCVLCQQPLGAAAVDRLARFKHFIEDVTRQDVMKVEQEIDQLRAVFGKLLLSSLQDTVTLLGEFAELRPEYETVRDKILDYYEKAQVYVAQLQKMLDGQSIEQPPARPVSISTLLNETATSLAERTKQLSAATANSAEIDKAQKDRADLVGAKLIHDNLSALQDRLSALTRLRNLAKCRKACDTTTVSNKGNALKTKYVTEDFKARIALETQGLDLDYLPITTEGHTEKGASFIGVALNAPAGEKASQVLSEGEFRCLALACFFAEIHSIPGTDGIILDDPVSSLDHLHSRQVAYRLVSEARTRQVIVFTHNLSFYYELWHAAMEEEVPVARHWVSVTSQSGCGTVLIDAAPWQAKKTKERIHELEETLAKIPELATCGSEQYLKHVEDFYSGVRETWERLVEERLFNGVVGRFQPGVKTQSLAGVVVEDDDFTKVCRGMTKASNYSGHDRATGKQNLMPNKSEMKKDLEELREYDKALAKRAEDVRKKRTPDVEAPKKAKMTM